MMDQTKGNLVNRRIKSLQISAVAISVFAVLALANLCDARTATQFNPIQPPQTQGTGNKSPARRIMDPAFANAGKNPGTEIWRIENFKPVAYPQRDFGKFYTGDSYIVLNTKKDRNNQFSWDIHFWLGSETTQDEAGAAAILTVQLDDLLNGTPIQHRETQDHESSLFLSYFKNGVRYEQGGVNSGFRHTETNAAGEKRLFQVKGKRNVRVRQVNLSVSSMNKGDCFILDAGNDIYVYVGSGAKRVEKLKATSAANQIRDQDHNGRARVQVVDDFSSDVDKEHFFTVLGSGSPSQVPDESTAEEDGAFETADERATTLYKVTDSAGSLKIDTISTKPLRQEMLDTNDCFILDTGSGLYVWVGKKATAQEKSQSLVKAQEFIRTKKYPAWTHVNRIVEGAESAPFKQYFATWRDVGMQHTRLIRSTSEKEPICEDVILERPAKLIKVIQFNHAPEHDVVLINDLTQYFKTNMILSSSAYIFQYEVEEMDEKYTILYVWEGSETVKPVVAEALKQANDLKKNSTNYTIVWMQQGYEPHYFLKLFSGTISSQNIESENEEEHETKYFNCVDGICKQIENFEDNDLYSDGYTMIDTGNKIYIWIGEHTTHDEDQESFSFVMDYIKENPIQKDNKQLIVIKISYNFETACFKKLLH